MDSFVACARVFWFNICCFYRGMCDFHSKHMRLHPAEGLVWFRMTLQVPTIAKDHTSRFLRRESTWITLFLFFFVYANEIAPHRGCEHPRIVVSIVERSSLPLNLSVLVKKLASASAWFFSLAQTCWNFFVWIGFRVLRLTLWKILRGRISKWFRLFVGCFFCAESKSGAWRVQQICTCLILRGGKKSVLSPRLRSFLFRKTNYSYLVFVYLVRATSPLPNVMKSYHVFSSYPFYYERIQSCVTGSFTFFHNIFLALAVENLSTCSIT